MKIEKQNATVREELEEKTKASIRAAESSSLLAKLESDLRTLSNIELSGDQRAIETAKDMKYLYDRQKSLVLFLKVAFGGMNVAFSMTNLCAFDVFPSLVTFQGRAMSGLTNGWPRIASLRKCSRNWPEQWRNFLPSKNSSAELLEKSVLD